nr:hypothetical protein GCM10020093_009570 [Planobispora longispora]
MGLAAPHPSVDAALDDAARWLADAGYEVEELELPMLAEASRLWSLLLFEDMRPGLPGMLAMADEGLRVHMRHAYEYAAELWGTNPASRSTSRAGPAGRRSSPGSRNCWAGTGSC